MAVYKIYWVAANGTKGFTLVNGYSKPDARFTFEVIMRRPELVAHIVKVH